MILRIVRMEFRPEKVDDFLKLFMSSKARISAFPGVRKLEFYRDQEKENVFYTLSHWNTDADLEKYRNSQLFDEIWSQTREMFSAKPQAFSLI